MDSRESDERVAECLEEYHRKRALREPVSPDDYRERLGDRFEDFLDVLSAESALDEVVGPGLPGDRFPRAFGAYTLLSELGGGAMGVVYEAVHRELGRKVALKVLRIGFDSEPLALERFRREARACAQVRHDSIVEIYEAGHEEGRPYYAMPILKGRSLAELVRAAEVPPATELCRGMARIADALHALHSLGIVHRDIKPANIMVAEDGKMVLADFGLARTASAQTLTQTGQALGTPLYMSPEQVLGKREEIDGRSDLYGLGATLYEALSGRPPFRAESFHSLMRMILSERPKPLSAVAPDVPRDAARIVTKAMAWEKKDRYQTAAELRDDLQAFAEGRAVTGRPVAPWRLLLRRRWKQLGLAAAAVVAVVAGLFWYSGRPGTLSVACTPEAVVWVDGEEHGPTPLNVRVPPGLHDVTLVQAGFGENRREVRIEPGEKMTMDIVLIADDPDDPATLARLGSRLGVEFDRFDRMEVRRGGDEEPPLLAAYPRGAVRLADLGDFRVDVNVDFEGDGTIEFRRGDEVLLRREFDPTNLRTIEPIPEELRSKLAVGDEVTWGYYPRTGEPVVEHFRVVEEPAVLAAIDAKLADQPAVLRGHFRAQVLREYGLWMGVLAEAVGIERLCGERPSGRALALQMEAWDRLGLGDFEPAVAAAGRFHLLPEEQRRLVMDGVSDKEEGR